MSDPPLIITTDEVVVSAGLLGGLVSSYVIDVGPGWIANALTFSLGAVPTLLITEAAMNDGGVNLMLIQRSFDFMTSSPGSFIIMTIGMVTVFEVVYALFLSEEVIALEIFVPLFRTANIDLVVVALGLMASFVFGGIAGWTIEVIEWVVAGGDKTKIPFKPSGRKVWSLAQLPKDLMYFVFAVPLGLLDQAELSYNKSSWVPLLMTPLKIACDQWTRIGDIIIDAVAIEEFIGSVLGNSWHVFDDVCSEVIKNATGGGSTTPPASSRLMDALFGHKNKPTPPSPSDNPYAAALAYNNGNMYHFHPLLFENGDATPSSS